MTSPDCVSAGLGIDVIEAEEVPNVRDLFEARMVATSMLPGRSAVAMVSATEYYRRETEIAWEFFQAGYRAAGGQGA